jgi:2-oxoglutarate ferredoxin oxidoreductase subunit beta
VLNYTLQAVDRIIQEGHVKKEAFVFVSGVGCSARLTSHYLNFDSGWTLHGRALAIATGALLANPALKLVVFTGDGDNGAIGGNHFIHTCRRNIDLTIICINNGLYGMTGGQLAPTTLEGRVTTTSPYGNIESHFDLCRLAETAGATFVARWTTAHPKQAIRSISRGIKKKGTAFIEILSQCPVHFKKTPVDMIKDLKKGTVNKNRVRGSKDERMVIGEFCDVEKPEWSESYQTILERADRESDFRDDGYSPGD